MGIRTDYYAVDRPRLDQYFNKTLAEFFLDAIKYKLDCIGFTFRDQDYTEYYTDGGGCIINDWKKDTKTLLGKNNFLSDRNLSISMKDYFAQNGDTYTLKYVCGGLTNISDVSWIRELSSGYKRHWMECLIYGIEPYFSEYDVSTIIRLFQKITLSFGLSPMIPDKSFDASDFDCPYIPVHENLNMAAGLWSMQEVHTMMGYFHKIIDMQIRFKSPPSPYKDDDDEGWNKWVYDMMNSLLQVESLGYEQVNIFTFTG